MVDVEPKKLLTDEKIAEMRAEIAQEDASQDTKHPILIEWSSNTIEELLDHIDILTAKLAEKGHDNGDKSSMAL